MPRTEGRKGFFSPFFPSTFPNTSEFANPQYFTAVVQPSFQFLSRLLRVRFGRESAKPNKRVARVIYSLIYGREHCSEDCIHYRSKVIRSIKSVDYI